MRGLVGLFLAMAGLAGCQLPTTAQRTGNLGNGNFSYVCLTGDSACSANGTAQGPTNIAAVFPSSVALDSRFRLTYELSSSQSSLGSPLLSPISPDYLSVDANNTDGDVFTAVKAGSGGIVARSSIDNSVIDFTLVAVVPVAALRIQQDANVLSTSTLKLSLGGVAALTATPLDGTNNTLAGAPNAIWTLSDPTRATLNVSGPAAAVQVTGTAPGTTTLNVATGSVESTLTITVGS